MDSTDRREQVCRPLVLTLVGLLLIVVLTACGAPSASRLDSLGIPPSGTDGAADRPPREGDSAGGDDNASGETAIDRAASNTTYEWVGEIVESDVEGPHLEIARDCDSWVLLPENDEIAEKLKRHIGEKVTVWETVTSEPSIYMRRAISVESAHVPGETVIDLYVPAYPCGGTMPSTPGFPVEPAPSPIYVGFDLLPGELAAVGKLVREGEQVYLVTESGRILLKGDALISQPAVPEHEGPVDGGGIVDPKAGGGIDGEVPPEPRVQPLDEPVTSSTGASGVSAPASCRQASDEVTVVGKWSVEDDTLVIESATAPRHMGIARIRSLSGRPAHHRPRRPSGRTLWASVDRADLSG